MLSLTGQAVGAGVHLYPRHPCSIAVRKPVVIYHCQNNKTTRSNTSIPAGRHIYSRKQDKKPASLWGRDRGIVIRNTNLLPQQNLDIPPRLNTVLFDADNSTQLPAEDKIYEISLI